MARKTSSGNIPRENDTSLFILSKQTVCKNKKKGLPAFRKTDISTSTEVPPELSRNDKFVMS